MFDMNAHKICSVTNCDKPHLAKGMCAKHYRKLRIYGNPLASRHVAAKTECCILGCGNKGKMRIGMCGKHYMRLMTHGDPSFGKPKASPGSKIKFILDHVDHDDRVNCLSWPFPPNTNGYGNLKFDGKQIVASRLMCILAHGEPKYKWLNAAHECGNGHLGCVNPHHLSWKTPAQNMADRVSHGTAMRGSSHANSLLTEKEVMEIRSINGTMTQSSIAKMYGVSFQTVSEIILRKSWAWLE